MKRSYSNISKNTFFEIRNPHYFDFKIHLESCARRKSIDEVNLFWPLAFQKLSYSNVSDYIKSLKKMQVTVSAITGKPKDWIADVYDLLCKAENMCLASRRQFVTAVLANQGNLTLVPIARGFLPYFDEEERAKFAAALEVSDLEVGSTPEIEPLEDGVSTEEEDNADEPEVSTEEGDNADTPEDSAEEVPKPVSQLKRQRSMGPSALRSMSYQDLSLWLQCEEKNKVSTEESKENAVDPEEEGVSATGLSFKF